jgi:hypothetical protein
MEASLLAGWDNFYVIVGSTAGALTGLTFVVVSLISDAQRAQPRGMKLFVTPTVVHFCTVLAIAALLAMPHLHVMTLSWGFAVAGAAGLIYVAWIAYQIGYSQAQIQYVPVAEDWIFNVIVPLLVHVGLLLFAWLVWQHTQATLYGVALLTLILLFTGIHNAWDIAVWLAISRKRETSQ